MHLLNKRSGAQEESQKELEEQKNPFVGQCVNQSFSSTTSLVGEKHFPHVSSRVPVHWMCLSNKF